MDFKKHWQGIGANLLEGALETIGKWAAILLIIIIAFTALTDWMRVGFDGTDDRYAGKRSGMALRTDHGTGCQYLESSAGHLTPRLDKSGQPIC